MATVREKIGEGRREKSRPLPGQQISQIRDEEGAGEQSRGKKWARNACRTKTSRHATVTRLRANEMRQNGRAFAVGGFGPIVERPGPFPRASSQESRGQEQPTLANLNEQARP